MKVDRKLPLPLHDADRSLRRPTRYHPTERNGAISIEEVPPWQISAPNSSASSRPNPFWLASAPPTDKEYNVVRAFKAGWGGVVWKTLGEDPPIVNVTGPRYGAIHGPTGG